MLTIYPNKKSANQSATWVDLLNPSDAELAAAGVEYRIALSSRRQLEEIESPAAFAQKVTKPPSIEMFTRKLIRKRRDV